VLTVKAQSNTELLKSIAEIDELLSKEGIIVDYDFNVSIEEGLQLAEILNSKLRPFIVQYTSLANKGKKYVPITADKFADYLPLCERLSRTEEVLLSTVGFAYGHSIKLITSGETTDIEDLIYELFICTQLTDLNGIINLNTLIQSSGFIGEVICRLTH
jgi:hypothetical protein